MIILRQFAATGTGLALLLAALASCAAPTFAQGDAKTGVTAPAGTIAPSTRHPSPLNAAMTAAAPTAEQKAQIKPITARYREARKALAPAPTAGADKPAMTPELRAQLVLSEDKEVAEIKAILTPAQQIAFQTAYDAAKAARGAGGGDPLTKVAEALSLTDAEKTAVSPILKDAAAQMQVVRDDATLDRRAKGMKNRAIWTDAKAKIRPLLTPEQQTTLDAMRGIGGGGGRRGMN